jgi:hypothetical protein
MNTYTREEEMKERHNAFQAKANQLCEQVIPEIPQQFQYLDHTISVLGEKVEMLRDKLSSVLRQEPPSPPNDESKACLSTSMGIDLHRLNTKANAISDVLSNIIRMIEL